MSELFKHRIKSEARFNFELDRVLANLDRAENWVRYNRDLLTFSKKSKKNEKEYEDSIKIRDEDIKLIRDMIEFGKSKSYNIDDYILRNLKARGLC